MFGAYWSAPQLRGSQPLVSYPTKKLLAFSNKSVTHKRQRSAPMFFLRRGPWLQPHAPARICQAGCRLPAAPGTRRGGQPTRRCAAAALHPAACAAEMRADGSTTQRKTIPLQTAERSRKSVWSWAFELLAFKFKGPSSLVVKPGTWKFSGWV